MGKELDTDVTVSFKMPAALAKKMDRMAKARRDTRSKLLRDLLEEEYDRILAKRREEKNER